MKKMKKMNAIKTIKEAAVAIQPYSAEFAGYPVRDSQGNIIAVADFFPNSDEEFDQAVETAVALS